ncbi:hypothetical protein ABZP36_009249 [Zizania latifolia]
MSEQQLPNKELEAQAAAATSHEAPAPAPAPGAKREEEAKRRVLIAGIKKLIRSFKSLSHIFEIYKEVDDDEGMEIDIEIGFPTDVQHVAHIGLDGSSNITSLRGMQEEARELLSLSTNLTMEQFEHAMASLAAHKEHSVVADRSSVAPS